MKISNTFLLLWVLIISFAFAGCNKCVDRKLRLDGSRSWLPLKGQSQLTFVDRTGQLKTFQMHVIDTTQSYLDSVCGTTTIAQYIHVSLYLDPQKSDYIFIQLSPTSSLFVRANTDSGPSMGIGGFLNGYGGKHGNFKDRLQNFKLGNNRYGEVLLITHQEGYSDAIDSLYLANGSGIIGFNYLHDKYVLE